MKIISIPPLGRDFDSSKQTFEALLEAVNTGQRAKKDILNSYISVQDLIDLELLQVGKDKKTILPFQPEFAAVTFLNGWSNYGSVYQKAGYYKHHGRVYLQGLIRLGTINQTAFTLPAGFRPALNCIFAVMSNDTIGRVDVNSSGNVVPINPPSSNQWVSLDGISFVAVQ